MVIHPIFVHSFNKYLWQLLKYIIHYLWRWCNVIICYLIHYEVIMVFIGCISHVLKINIITIFIICHASYTTFYWKFHIFFCIRFICWMQSDMKIYWKYNYYFSLKIANSNTNRNKTLWRIIRTHPTKHLVVRNKVNIRERIMHTANTFLYN